MQKRIDFNQIAVITPYSGQVALLSERINDEMDESSGKNHIEIGTVDGFQRREKEMIIISLVRSNEENQIGFLADLRRLNVALTRAK